MNANEEIYKKLPTGRPYLRLLRLSPAADPTTSIGCELLEVPLGSAHTYTALSYAWKEKGDVGISTAEIIVKKQSSIEEVRVVIPRNLFLALRRLRQKSQSILLWVDSICINQEDNGERTHQVGMMSEIYRHASQVDIWLGERELDDELGEWLQGISQRAVVYTDWHDTGWSKALVDKYLDGYSKLADLDIGPLRLKNDVYGAFCLIWFLSQGEKPADVKFYDTMHPNRFRLMWTKQVSRGLRALMERNWWSRSWVVQETVIAKKARIVYSDISAPWTMFSQAALNYLHNRWIEDLDQLNFILSFHPAQGISNQQDEDALSHFSTSVMAIERTRIEWTTQQPISLLPLLRRFRSRNSSDRRDKVFSFLGLLNRRTDFPILVDYDHSVEQVYIDAVIQLMRETRSLSVLAGSVQGPENSPSLCELPSWTTDWSSPEDEFGVERLEFSKLYDASKGSLQYAVLHCRRILEIKGFIVGEIKHEFGPAPQSGIERLRNTILRWEREWRKDYGRNRQAFWRTMCGDILYDAPTGGGSTIFEHDTLRRALERDEDAFTLWTTDESNKRNRLTSIYDGFIANGYTEPAAITRQKNAYYYSARASLLSRRFFACKMDRTPSSIGGANHSAHSPSSDDNFSMGVGPQSLTCGDYVFVAFGSRVPFVIRKSAKHECSSSSKHDLFLHQEDSRNETCSEIHDTFRLVGDAYVHGIMDGEILASKLEPCSIFLA